MNKISLLIAAICGMFIIVISGPADAQMMGGMQTHNAMQIGVQKMIDGSLLMEGVFKLVDAKAISIAQAEPILKQANQMIQDGYTDVVRAQQQMKTKMEMKKPEEIKPVKRHLKMQEMKGLDRGKMKDEPTKKPDAAEIKEPSK